MGGYGVIKTFNNNDSGIIIVQKSKVFYGVQYPAGGLGGKGVEGGMAAIERDTESNPRDNS